MKSKTERLRNFKKENKHAANKLHRTAIFQAKKIASHFKRKLVTEAILPPYIVDIYFESAKIALEVDGKIHDFKENYDDRRDNYLKEKYGVMVVRLNENQIYGKEFKKIVWWALFQDSISILKKNYFKAEKSGYSESIPSEFKQFFRIDG